MLRRTAPQEAERGGLPRSPFGSSRDAEEHDRADGDHAEVADAAQRLGQDDEQQGADHRSGHAAQPADDDHGQNVDRFAELKLVGTDEIGRVGKQCTGDAG